MIRSGAAASAFVVLTAAVLAREAVRAFLSGGETGLAGLATRLRAPLFFGSGLIFSISSSFNISFLGDTDLFLRGLEMAAAVVSLFFGAFTYQIHKVMGLTISQ